jgi:hypothetical protein
LLNIDGVVQGKCKKLLLATPSRKEVQLSKRNGIEFFGGWKLANTQLNTPAAKANLLFQNKRKRDFSKL